MVESAEVMTIKSSQTLSCSECEQDLAVCFCCECFQNMCESCANRHKKSVNFLAHEISYKKMFQEKVKKCQEHNEVLKFFCNKCRLFICHECTLSINHSEHTFSLVDELVSDRKEKLKRLVQEAEKKKKTIESITLDAETTLELIKISNEKNINTVEANFQLIHEALHTHQLNLIKSINEKYTESVNSIKQAKGSNNILSDCINFTNEVIESRCKTEIIDIFENLKRQLQNMTSLTVKRVSTRQSAYAESDIIQITNIDNSSSKDLSCTEESEFTSSNSLNGFHADPPDKIRQHFGPAPGTSFTKSKLEDCQKNIIENCPQNFKLKKKLAPSIKSIGSKSNKEKNFLNLPPVQKIPAEKKKVHSEKTPPPRPPPVKILPEKISSHPPPVKSPSEIPPPRPANPPHKSASSSTAPPKPPAPKILLMSEENTPSLKPVEKTICEEKCNDNVNKTLDSKGENIMQSSDVVADLCNEKTETNARKLSTGTPARYINVDEKPNGINEDVSYITHNEEYLINQELIGIKTENYYDFVGDTSDNSLYATVDKLRKLKDEPNFSVKEKNEQSNGKNYCPLNSAEETVVHETPLPHKTPPKKPQRPRCLAGIELKQVRLVRNNEVLQSVLMNLEQACAIHIQVQPTERNCQIFSLNEDVIYM